MENKIEIAEGKILAVKAKLLEEIGRHNSSIMYGVRQKAKDAFEHILKANTAKSSAIVPIEVKKEDWDKIVDFVRFVMKDRWCDFGGYPDDEVVSIRIKEDILKILD